MESESTTPAEAKGRFNLESLREPRVLAGAAFVADIVVAFACCDARNAPATVPGRGAVAWP